MPFDRQRFADEYPFAPHYLDLGGVRMHFLDEGPRDGKSVLCLHGNPTWSFFYRHVVKALRATHRVIVPDHIGCGLSDKPDDTRYEYTLARRVADIEALLRNTTDGVPVQNPQSAIQNPQSIRNSQSAIRHPTEPSDAGANTALDGGLSLIAHDWGGMIAMALAVRRPAAIRRIVLMNTAAFFPPAGKRLPLRLRVIRDSRWFGSLAVRGFNAFAGAAVHMATARGLSADLRAAYTAPYDSWANRIATLSFVQDIPLHPGDRSYAAVKSVEDRLHVLAGVPMLILWGERDFVFDRDYLAEWRRRFPRAEVHTFPDAGHYVLEDEHDRCLELIREFMGKSA